MCCFASIFRFTSFSLFTLSRYCARVYLMSLPLNHLNLGIRGLERRGAHIFCIQLARFLVPKPIQFRCNYCDGRPGQGMFHDRCLFGTYIVIWTMTRRQSESHTVYPKVPNLPAPNDGGDKAPRPRVHNQTYIGPSLRELWHAFPSASLLPPCPEGSIDHLPTSPPSD